MAIRTVTYNAWDHNRQVVPANLQPRVGFRPIATSLANGMLNDREIWGSLNASTGAGSVQLESLPGIAYVPFMEWLVDESQATEAVQNRVKGYCEWKPFHPANGGPIDELPDMLPTFGGFYYGLGDPPTFLRSRKDVLYIDIAGADDGYWQPWVPEGTAVEV